MTNRLVGLDEYLKCDRPKHRKLRLDQTPQENWNLHIPLKESKPATVPANNNNKTEENQVRGGATRVIDRSGSGEGKRWAVGELPDLPLLLDPASKQYPYDSTTNHFHKSLPEDAYKERHAGMHFQKDSPMSKSVRTVAPFNPFNRVNPTSGGREAPPELMNDLDE